MIRIVIFLKRQKTSVMSQALAKNHLLKKVEEPLVKETNALHNVKEVVWPMDQFLDVLVSR